MSTKRTYKKRKYGKMFSPSVYQVAKQLERQKRIADATRNYNTISPYLSDVNVDYWDGTQMAKGTFSDRVAQLALAGKGKYGWRKAARGAGGDLFHAFGGSRKAGRRVGGLAYGAIRHATGGQNLVDLAKSYAGMGGYIPRTRGSGSYQLNSLVQGSSIQVPQMMGSDEIGTIVVSHKEFLGTISGSTNFENVGFALNPGLATSFPWLSQIAANYEEYSFEQLVFCYTSLLSETTSTGSVGQIIMTTNYNAGQPIYQTTNGMLNNIGTVSGRPIDSPIIHGVECDDEKNVQDSHFIRTGAVPIGQDVKTYDLGVFQLATEGMPSTGQLQGQLWVSYQCTLRKPRLFSALGRSIRMDVHKSSSGISVEKMTGNPVASCPANNIGTVLIPTENELKVQFPTDNVDGIYRVDLIYKKAEADGGEPVAPSFDFQNCSPYLPTAHAVFWGENSYVFFMSPVTGVNDCITSIYIVLDGNNIDPCSMTMSWRYSTFSATNMSCLVTQVNPDIVASTGTNLPPEWPVVYN